MRHIAFTIEDRKKIKDKIEFEECLCVADGTCPNCGVTSKYYVLLVQENEKKEVDSIMACGKKSKKKKTGKK